MVSYGLQEPELSVAIQIKNGLYFILPMPRKIVELLRCMKAVTANFGLDLQRES